jgi:hypothetical protein
MLLTSRGSDSFHIAAVILLDVGPDLNNTAVSGLVGTGHILESAGKYA